MKELEILLWPADQLNNASQEEMQPQKLINKNNHCYNSWNFYPEGQTWFI